MADLCRTRPALPHLHRRVAASGAALVMVVLCAGIPDAVHAERIYRCGSQGSVYSQTPCRGEHQQSFEVDDARDAEQRAEAQGVAARAQAAADRRSPAAANVQRGTPARAGSLSGPFGRVRVPFEGHEIDRPRRCDQRKRPRSDACR
jgi:hypothetical protein